jgi:hypothetical protein
LTILKFVVRSSEVGSEVREKIFRDDFHRNFPPSVFNSKVMSGIMRVIVVNAIEVEWMVSLQDGGANG